MNEPRPFGGYGSSRASRRSARALLLHLAEEKQGRNGVDADRAAPLLPDVFEVSPNRLASVGLVSENVRAGGARVT